MNKSGFCNKPSAKRIFLQLYFQVDLHSSFLYIWVLNLDIQTMHNKYFLLIPFFCFLIIGRANAQTVAPDRIALRKALSIQDGGYSMRSNDQRFEGFYNKEKGEEDFRVFSLLRGKLDYVMSANECLTILTRKLPGTDSLYIAGTSFNFSPDYRLDIHLKAGENAHVPLSAAIKSKNLFENHLGIYGYTGIVGSPDCYVPIEVRSSVNKKNDAVYVLTLISIKSVSDITWDYTPANRGLLAEPTKGAGTITYVPERSPITIPLVFGKDVIPGAVVVVQVWGRLAGHSGKERLQELKIIIPKA
jgi:hypothetical protein